MLKSRLSSRLAGRLPSVIPFGAAASAAADPPLLDTYTGAAAAYSLRLLRTEYEGALIRVRRSSDDAEADIDPDENGDLDTAALLAHCGAGDGFVTTVYEQSGAGTYVNHTQTTAALQPRIVDSGAVDTQGGLVAISLLSKKGFRSVNADAPAAVPWHVFAVLTTGPNSSMNSARAYLIESGIEKRILWFGGTSSDLLVSTQNFAIDLAENTRYLVNGVVDGASSAFRKNGAADASGTLTNQSSRILSINNNASINYMDMWLQELVVYESNQSANNAGIEGHMNDYWSVY